MVRIWSNFVFFFSLYFGIVFIKYLGFILENIYIFCKVKILWKEDLEVKSKSSVCIVDVVCSIEVWGF